jgi:aspartate dehydrogenase
MRREKKLRIGVVGCGAIGSSLAKKIVSQFYRSARLSGVYDIASEKAEKLAVRCGSRALAASSLMDLIRRSDLLIEATHATSAFPIAAKTLNAFRDIMVMSVGGILAHYRELKTLAQKKGRSVFIPSGALAAVDSVKAAACGKITKVTLTTSKPVRAFSGVAYVVKKRIRLDRIKKDTVIFQGSALAATRAFPQNINVAATLSLAGIGAKKTTVKMVASPRLSKNIHEVEVDSASGRIISRTENVVHPENPKTSYLAVLSAIATLKQILGPVKIGT